MDRIEKRKIYLDYLENLNESKSREKNIKKVTDKIEKFIKNKKIIDFLVDKVVDKESSKGTKYLLWFAKLVKNNLLEWLLKEFPNDDSNKYINLHNLELNQVYYTYYTKLLIYLNDIDYMITTIVDWLKSPLREENEDLSKYDKLIDVYNIANEWHEELNASGNINEEHGKVIMTFPDGFYWIDLQTTNDKDEAEAMGHCGTTTEGTTILSLRKNKSPHVTMAIDDEDLEIITQIKGRNNKKPIKKYHKYIVDLMMNPDFKPSSIRLEYDNDGDFSVDDLEPELYKKLIKHNPAWLESKFHSNKFIENFKGDIEVYEKLYKSNSFIFYNIILELLNNEYVDEETGDLVVVKHESDENMKKILNIINTTSKKIDTGSLQIENSVVTLQLESLFINFVDYIRPTYDQSIRLGWKGKIHMDIVKKIYSIYNSMYHYHIDDKEISVSYNFNELITSNTLDYLSKLPTSVSMSQTVKNLTKKYDEEIHIPRMKEEQKKLYKYFEDYLKFKIVNVSSKDLTLRIDVLDYFKLIVDGINLSIKNFLHLHGFRKAPHIQSYDNLQNSWNTAIEKLVDKKKYQPEYDIVSDFNQYIIDNVDIKN